MVDKLSSNMDKSQRKVKELHQNVSNTNKELEQTEKISNRLTRSVGKLAAAFSIKELVANVTKVRGQFQQLEVAFTTMLQSAEKADSLMQQLTKTAATTPFGLEDVAQGAKQLLAYGFEAEKVNETLIRLGDIAAGLSVPLNDLVYLYGTTMAQGRMYTQDLNQFTNRGIPMIAELAKQFGVAEDKVKELVEAGKVGFPEVQKVVESLTNEGGKFGGLMEEQSKTITGQISNIEDSISMMFNELGQQSEGIINTTLSNISDVIEHYERFGRILLGLVATYGTYKSAIMLVTAAKGWATASEALHYNWLLLVEKAQKMLNATMLANPYVLVATLITGVVAAMVSMKTEAERMKEADEAYEAQKQKVIEAEEEHKRRLEELAGVAGDESLSTDTRREALNKLEQKYPDIFAKYDTEIEKLKNIKKIKEEIAALEGQKSISRPENEVKDVNKRIEELESILKSTYTVTKNVYNHQTLQWERKEETVYGTLSRSQAAELKMLKGKRDSLNTTIRKNQVNSYFENLTGVSNETIDQQIKQRENLLAKMVSSEKKYGTIIRGDSNLTGTYSRDELQYQLNKLRTEKNKRNAPRNSGSEWASKAKKDYEKALKAYNDFIGDKNHKLTEEEFEKRRKELKDDLDQKKKEYDNVKPSTDSDADKKAKQRKKEQADVERRKQTQERLGQELVELQQANDEAEIEAMDEGLQKKLREIENEYQARKNALDKLESKWKRDNKKAGIVTGADGLTTDQADALREAHSQADAIRKKKTDDVNKANLQSMREYLKEYGDELQQEVAITEDYQDQIAKARANGDEGKALILERKLQEELSNMRLTNLRKSPEYIRAFEDLGKISTQTLQSLIKKFEDAKEAAAKSLDTNQLREYTDTLQQMYDELANRNPFEALTKALQELADAQKEAKDAQDIFNKVKGGQTVINKSTGNSYTEAEASELLANAKDKESKAYTKLTKAATACAQRLKQFSDTMNQLGEMVGGKLGDSLSALGSMLESVSGAFDNIKGLNVNATGFEKTMGQFSAVAGTVSAMVEMNRQLDKLLPDADSLYEHYAAKQRELNEKRMRMIELEIEQLEQRLDAESWFYENGLTQLKKNAELNAEYAKAYGEVAAMPQEVYKNASSGFSKWAPAIIGAIVGIVAGVFTFGAGAGAGAALGAAIGSAIGGTAIGAALGATVVATIGTAIFSGVGAALGNAVRAGIEGLTYKEGQTAAINNMRVQTRHKTFFRSEKTQDLQSWVKENWGQDLFEDVKGVQLIDPEVAKKLLEDGPTLVGETRETLEQLLEYSEKIHEFLDQVHEYVSEAFSPLVDNLTDAIWDWLSNGEDVMDKFKEYAGDTFRDIAKDALKAMITKNIFEPFQEQLEDLTIAYSTGQIDETAYMAGVAEFAKQASAAIEVQLPVLQNAAEVMEMAMKDAGIDIGTGEGQQQTGKVGALTTISQDQGTKLEGLFVSGQMHWASMDEKMKDVSVQIGLASDTLKRIEEHTGSSARSLEEIKEDIKIIKRDGIKVK